MEEAHEINKEEEKDRSSNLWLGLAFIVGGMVILLNQLDILPFDLNWWALFIMLPAAGLLNEALNHYRSHKNLFSTGVGIPALIGLFLAALSFSLLVGDAWEIDWSLLWPLILIVIGLSMIFNRSREE